MAENSNTVTALAEAQAAADGDRVIPITGADVAPDMIVRHNGEWLAVKFKTVVASDTIRIDFAMDEPGSTAYRFAAPTSTLYRRTGGDK